MAPESKTHRWMGGKTGRHDFQEGKVFGDDKRNKNKPRDILKVFSPEGEGTRGGSGAGRPSSKKGVQDQKKLFAVSDRLRQMPMAGRGNTTKESNQRNSTRHGKVILSQEYESAAPPLSMRVEKNAAGAGLSLPSLVDNVGGEGGESVGGVLGELFGKETKEWGVKTTDISPRSVPLVRSAPWGQMRSKKKQSLKAGENQT